MGHDDDGWFVVWYDGVEDFLSEFVSGLVSLCFWFFVLSTG